MNLHRSTTVGVRANAVGAGIAHSIKAQAAQPDPESEASWVEFCITAANEAAAAVVSNPPMLDGGVEGTAARLLRELGSGDEDEDNDEPEFMEGATLRAVAHAAASEAFRLCMPRLTSKRRVRSFIACAAVGLQRGFVLPGEAKALLYTAQLALSAYPTRRAPRGRKA